MHIFGIVLGVACAALTIWLWRIQPEPNNNRLRLNVVGLPSAEFAFLDPNILRGELSLGHSATGTIELRNQTGRTLHVRIRGKPTEPEVGKTLRIDVKAGTTTIFHGDIEGLGDWVADPIPIKSGKVEKLDVKTSVQRQPDGSLDGLGQDVTVTVEVQRSG
jgi:hypothetical protein